MKMTDNAILITGGGSGIGRALAQAFHARRNRVVIAGRDRDKLEGTAARNPGMMALTVDMESVESIRQLARMAGQACPTLNVVIHCAGIMKAEDLLGQTTPASDPESVIATNLLGPIRLNRELVPLMRKQPHATIMMISSGLGFVPMAAVATYCATKAAIHSYSQSLRYQLRDTPIEVLELIPPYIATGLMGAAQAQDPNAMPLDQFTAEALQILETQPEAREVCVKRVDALRSAELNGREAFEKIFSVLNSPALQPWTKT